MNELLLTPLELAGTFVTVLRERIDQDDFEAVMAGRRSPRDFVRIAEVMGDAFQRLHSRTSTTTADTQVMQEAFRAVRVYLAGL